MESCFWEKLKTMVLLPRETTMQSSSIRSIVHSSLNNSSCRRSFSTFFSYSLRAPIGPRVKTPLREMRKEKRM